MYTLTAARFAQLVTKNTGLSRAGGNGFKLKTRPQKRVTDKFVETGSFLLFARHLCHNSDDFAIVGAVSFDR